MEATMLTSHDLLVMMQLLYYDDTNIMITLYFYRQNRYERNRKKI